MRIITGLAAVIALAFAALALAAPASAAPPTISKSEIRSDPPAVTDKRLRDAIWGMFEPQDLRTKKEPTRPLSRLFLQTRTRATAVPGLCRYDRVIVEFKRVDPKDKDADAPTRPVGLKSSSYYTFLSPPAGEYEAIANDEGTLAEKACSGLPAETPFFVARDEQVATTGYRDFQTLQDAIRSRKTVKLDCNLYPADKETCGDIILALKPEDIGDIDVCDSDSGSRCSGLYVGDRLVTVVATCCVSPGPPTGQIVSAKLDSLITIADAVVD